MTPRRPRIAVTMGDPAGVGPELCLRLLDQPTLRQACIPIVFGDRHVLQEVARVCRLPLPPRTLEWEEWQGGAAATEPLLVSLPIAGIEHVVPGRVSEIGGRASYHYFTTAIEAARGEVAAITTGPINKEALHAAGYHYPGHTEILAERTDATRSCMMLTAPEITCSFVTTHIGYYEVRQQLTTARIIDVIELTIAALRRMRGSAQPLRIAVCGLNPHAGEHGLFGNGEEETIIQPAIAACQADDVRIEGPLPPDTAFLRGRRAVTDAFICMYHDQGHIPLKALAFETAVNTTLGLPVVRTSVDHGTAYDIAWQGSADPSSLYQAIELAIRLSDDGSFGFTGR